MFRRVNPYLSQRLNAYLQSGDVDGMAVFLATLSTAEHKTAGHLLSTEILIPIADATFSECFIKIVPQNSKIYLTTFLKAFCKRCELKRSSLNSTLWQEYATLCPTEIDCQKLLTHLLPLAHSHHEVDTLLNLYAPHQAMKRIGLLIRIPTLASTYALFLETLKDESSTSMLRSVCIALAKRGDVCAGRLASLLVAYHALTPIPGIAPSNVAPYKFSRLSESLEAFLATLEINP